jgi:hypothetical protein
LGRISTGTRNLLFSYFSLTTLQELDEQNGELYEQNDDRKSKKNDTSPTERVRPIRPLPHRNLVDRALEDLRRQASDNVSFFCQSLSLTDYIISQLRNRHAAALAVDAPAA